MVIFLPFPDSDDDENVLIVSNTSWTATANLTFSPFGFVEHSEIIPFPNPYTITSSNTTLLFTKPAKGDSLTDISIYNEFGFLVNTIELDRNSENWDWNLKDISGNTLIPGMYFLKTDAQSPKPLLVVNAP